MIRSFVSLLFCFALAACATETRNSGDVALPEPSLEMIADGVWVHKAYRIIDPWGPVLSQGLVVDTGEGVALVDTAWDDEDTKKLLALIRKATGQAPDIAIITHAHSDKMGGVGALNEAGVGGRAHPFTNADAPERGLRPTQFTILDGIDYDTLLGVSQTAEDLKGPIEVYYPGPGHARDNIVVYYAPAKVLFGGCLIRPGGSTDLGNTADADIGHWAQAVRNVASQFPDAETIIPSHGPMGGRELLGHTIELADAAAAEL